MPSRERAPSAVQGYPHGRVPRAVREEQLLAVAQALFVARGFDGASIEQIAQAAGVTRPVIYEHFGGKDGLYLACLRRARAALGEAIAEAVGGGGEPLDLVERGIDGYFAFLEGDPERWTLLFGAGAAVTGDLAEEVVRLRFDTVGGIAALLRGVVPDADPVRLEAFAHALSGAGEQLAKWWRRNQDVSRGQVVGYLRDFSWPGLSRLLAGDDSSR
jgi:AcrR family transcriptional regulator